MEKVARKVVATRHMHTLAPLSMPMVRKTACYIRVSTLDGKFSIKEIPHNAAKV